MKPVLFVTGHAPAYRVGAFQRLHERQGVEFALFGGRLKHGGGASAEELAFPHRHVREREVYRLARSGRYRAVVCSTGGRLALPAAWAGARRARVPLLLWTSLWAHPRTAAHALSWPALRRLYRSADAVVAYGPHVRDYVRARGARNVHIAPQAADNEFWSSPEVRPPSAPGWPAEAPVKFLFAGRAAREKGLGVLREAWISSGLRAPTAALVLVGVGSTPPWVPAGGAVGRAMACASPTAPSAGCHPMTRASPAAPSAAMVCLDPVSAVELRNLYAASDVLVLPSIRTRSFREPWGLVINEAMNQGLAVIATDAVGAAAGGLVRAGRNGLIVPANDSRALAGALRRLAEDRELRTSMGEAGREDVKPYTHEAWAAGFSRALASVALSRERC
jgi:glycosyltransferase involved in cell wall biosynthesis